MFDSSIPSSLLEMQLWFSDIIETPLQPNNLLPETKALDASLHIAPSPTLTARERIEIYHQQYWWRLLEVMQENFPAVTRLFGYREFNAKIAVPYLKMHPSQNHTLNELGNQLPTYLEQNYHDADKNLVLAMAQIDLWTNFSHTATHFPLPAMDPSDLISMPLALQSHIHLYAAPADFLTFREKFLKNPPEYYETEPFPELSTSQIYAMIYRSLDHHVSWKFLSEPAFRMLSLIQKGKTISEACAHLEDKNVQIGDEIAVWFYEWISLQLFTKKACS